MTITNSDLAKFFKFRNDTNNQAILEDLSKGVKGSYYLTTGKRLEDKFEDLKLQTGKDKPLITQKIMRDDMGFPELLIRNGKYEFSDCRVLYRNRVVLSKAIEEGQFAELGKLSSFVKKIREINNKQKKVESKNETTETETEGKAEPTANALGLDEVQMIVGGFKKLPPQIQVKIMKDIIKENKFVSEQINKFVLTERTVKPVLDKTTVKTVSANK